MKGHFRFQILSIFMSVAMATGVFVSTAFSQVMSPTMSPFGPPDCSLYLNKYSWMCLPPAVRTLPPQYFPSLYNATLPLYPPSPGKPKRPKPRVSSQAVYAAAVNQNNFNSTVKASVLDPINTLNDRHPDCNCVVGSPAVSIPDTTAQKDLDNCNVHGVTGLPGSQQYSSDFIESMSVDPDPAKKGQVVYGITSDVSSNVTPPANQAMYVSKSLDGGKTWIGIARINSKYYSAGDSLRNGISVGPGGHDIVVTTLKGAFQLSDPPQVDSRSSTNNPSGMQDAVLKPIDGPNASPNANQAGDVKVSPDGNSMIVSYGADEFPSVIAYHKDQNGIWVKDSKNFSKLPTTEQILSLQYDPKNPHSAYAGTGDQVYHYDPTTQRWNKISGVGIDSSIHAMTTTGGLHLATCWGTYRPSSTHDTVIKTAASSKIRAYGIDVDPNHPEHVVVTAAQGVFISTDGGKTLTKYTGKSDDGSSLPECESAARVESVKSPIDAVQCNELKAWKAANRKATKGYVPLPKDLYTKDLYTTEFRTAHFTPDGAIVVSGSSGTYLANPFAPQCSGALKK